MADKPILFSGPMVRALLAGTKTQTRRALNPQPHFFRVWQDEATKTWWQSGHGEAGDDPVHLRIAVGDRLYVRETCSAVEAFDGTDVVQFDADAATILIQNSQEAAERWAAMHHYGQKRGASVPSIHMPRWASRITLTVTDVRVERLQDISDVDAMREGVESLYGEPWFQPGVTHRRKYHLLWDHINGLGAWDANPWVAAYTFTVQMGNIDQLGAA